MQLSRTGKGKLPLRSSLRYSDEGNRKERNAGTLAQELVKFNWTLQFQELGNNTLPVNVSPAVRVPTCCALVASVWICPWTTWVPDTGWAKRIYCSWPAFN